MCHAQIYTHTSYIQFIYIFFFRFSYTRIKDSKKESAIFLIGVKKII